MTAHWLTIGEAAKVLGISLSRLRYLADAGRIPGVQRTRSGRRLLPVRSVEALAEGRRKAGRQRAERSGQQAGLVREPQKTSRA